MLLPMQDDDVVFLYICNAFVSLFSVSGLPSFKEHIFRRTTFSGCLSNLAYAIRKIILSNSNYVRCLNLAPMEKTWFMAPVEYTSWFIAQMEKAWFYEGLFFKVVIAMVKD